MKNIALVHDDFMQWGGAERLVAALAEKYPEAPVYTSMVDTEVLVKAGIDSERIISSWLDSLPFKKRLNKFLFLFYPIVFESFDFSSFDVVISSSTRYAHGVVTKPDTQHFSYINSPFRGFWEPDLYFGESSTGVFLKKILGPILSYMRKWDYVAGQRSDVVFANSKTAQARVKKYHRRNSEVLYPFVDFERFDKGTKEKDIAGLKSKDDDFYIMISRLVEWKRLDIAIQAFNEMEKHLVIVGKGNDKERLERLAGKTVHITGFLSDEELNYLLTNAKGLIHPQKEDFGMTVVEGNYCGLPAIAFEQGGAQDTIIDKETGLFFSEQTAASLIKAIEQYEAIQFDSRLLKEHAQKFSKDIFLRTWVENIKNVTEES